jgi:hypothetical protein
MTEGVITMLTTLTTLDNNLPDTGIPVTDDANIPVTDGIDLLRLEVAELKAMLAPLAPLLASLPELMEKVDPLIDGLKKSPVLKALGVKIP